ncbi:MAG TPA: 16S rRNA (cytosine(1402)-N(4))-methyltransferase RsmH [Gemmataceae bacterium]|nr:16S rRNA (cytosine(1402)-N(4))-methyltransferase RsmH [Gemmataceae bacterium]
MRSLKHGTTSPQNAEEPKRFKMRRGQRSTPAGEHRPVLLQEVLGTLQPQPGDVVADCTVGWAGHALELLQRVGPTGRLVGIDFDIENLPRARERLETLGGTFSLRQGNFAGLSAILAEEGLPGVDVLIADLGMSSMQVDNAERGFSYRRDGPLDMRMDQSRGRTAAQILAAISEEDLAAALREFGDEPDAELIAKAIVAARQQHPLERTADLSRVILDATQEKRQGAAWRLHPMPQRWNLHPAARTFQTLRILVNRELANLEQLLRVLPLCLQPGGRAAIISFHSGEDRLVKTALRAGHLAGTYSQVSSEPLRGTSEECAANPRSRSAKLRWAKKASQETR